MFQTQKQKSMKLNIYLNLILIITFIVTGISQTRLEKASDTDLVKLTNRFHNAILNSDENELKSILAPQLEILINKNKDSTTRDEYISFLKSSMQNLLSIEAHNIVLSNNEYTVTVDLDLTINQKSSSLYPTQHLGSYRYIFKKNNDSWQIISIQLQK